MRATRFRWYKKWHDFRYAHHFHVLVLFVYALGLLASIFNPSPHSAFAANGSWPQTTFNGTSDGTYNNTASKNTNNDVGLRSTVNTGTGLDGDLSVTSPFNINLNTNGNSGRTQPDAVRFSVTALSPNTATLSSTPSTGALRAGDEVLLINLQGTTTNNTNVGNYEVLRVQSDVTTSTVTFTTNKAKYYGNGASDDTNLGTAASNQKVMLQRVPNYRNVTIGSTSSTIFEDTFAGTTIDTNKWVEIDPANQITQNSGLIFSSGTAGWTRGIIGATAENRTSGKALYGKFTTGSSVGSYAFQFGWGANQASSLATSNMIHGIYMGWGNIYITQNDNILGSVGSYVANTEYELKVQLLDRGARMLIKGGTYTDWTTIFVDTTISTSPLRPMISIYNSIDRFNLIKIENEGGLYTSPWDGARGGVLFFRADGSVALDSAINLGGLGYRGGWGINPAYPATGIGIQGEGIATGQNLLTSANLTGGGAGSPGNGSDGRSSGDGGGGGGYATNGAAGSEGGIYGSNPGPAGFGGGTVGEANLQKIYLGSGGGSGGESVNASGGRGGSGGGIVIISAESIVVNSNIKADGFKGMKGSPSDGGGGGGGGASGGSIILEAGNLAIGDGLVTANGGIGGTGGSGSTTAGGNGGSGGNGRVKINYSTLSGSTSPAAAAVVTPTINSGEYTSATIPDPGGGQAGKIYSWGDIVFSRDITETGSSLHIHVLQGNGNLVPDTDLPGNNNGFSSSPISLSSLNNNIANYGSLKLRADLARGSAGSPLLQSWEVSYSYDVTAPTTPSNLQLTNKTDTSATLGWTISTDTESSAAPNGNTIVYHVERAPDSAGSIGSWSEVGTSNTDFYTDNSLVANTKYYYRIRAKDFAGNYSGYTYNGLGTGGTITYTDSNGLNPRSNTPYANGYVVHTFNSNSTFVSPSAMTISALVVAGGGAGGGSAASNGGAGGGGAGGLISNNSLALSAQSYPITIGNGGTPAYRVRGGNGGNTTFAGLTAVGGGGGGTGDWDSQASVAQNGGSGGGAGYRAYMTATVGNGTAGQGNNGGQNGAPSGAGGGGGGGATGAGQAGLSNHSGGLGGTGFSSSISGNPVVYSTGGTGGGGALGQADGAANTGNGGGGTYALFTTGYGYAGGSGVVIVRYPYVPPVTVTTKTATPVINSISSPLNQNKPTITGTTSPNVTVKLFDGSTEVASTTSDGSGNFTFNTGTYSQVLSEGSHSSLVARSYNSANEASLDSNQLSTFVDTIAPTVPSGLTFGSTTNNQTTLSWTQSTDGGTGLAEPAYYIERALDSNGVPGVWNQIATTSATSLVQSGLSPNTKYYYRVRAKDAAANDSDYDDGAHSIEGNTVTLWRFNEGEGGSLNDSVGVNDGTIAIGPSGTQTTTAHAWSNGSLGKFDNSLNFDGSDDRVNAGSFFNYQAFTIEMWINPAATQVAYADIMDNSHGSSNWVIQQDYNSANNYYFAYYKTSTTTDFAYFSLTPNVWQHLAITRDPSLGTKVYKNGEQVGSSPTTGNIYYASQNLTIANMTSGGRAFKGKLDDIRISNVAISQNAIQSYYNASLLYPKYSQTLSNSPVLNMPDSPTNDSKPLLSNSEAPDLSFAGRDVYLYDGETHIATATANGSGVFTFSDGNYTQSLTDGLHGNISAKAKNNAGELSAASPNISIMVDTVAPTAPTTRTAAKVESDSGADIDDSAWNGHNNTDSVYFAWSGATDQAPASNIKRYWVYFGSLAGAVPRTDGQATSNATASAIKTLTNPASGTDYYLRIQTEDNAGNISSDGAIPTLFVYKFDNTKPSNPTSIVPSPAAWSTENDFDFDWNNWTEAHSGLSHYLYVRKTSPGGDSYEEIDTLSRKITDVENPVELNNLEALYNGVNIVRVYAVDRAGNISTVYGSSPYFYSGTVTGPVITPGPVFNSENSFSFALEKPQDVNVTAYYCGLSSPISPENSTYIKLSDLPKEVTINGKNLTASLSGNSVNLSAFAAATQTGQNRLYCATENETGNIGWTTATSAVFTVNTEAPDVPTGLKITDASDRGTSNWALTVGWSALTNQPPDFNGYEVWRCTLGCDQESNFSKVADVTTNIYSEASLSNFVQYYYKVKARDNVGVTSDFSGVVSKIPTGKYTTPPEYTSQPVAEPKATEVDITWTTNRPTNSIVRYGTTTSYGQEVSKSTEAVTSHKVTVKGLTPGTTYHYQVQSLDQDRDYNPDVAYSADFSFKTSPAPGISEVSVSEIRLTTAIITWKTTSSATSKILYGTNTSYGQVFVDSSSSQTTTHTVKLTDLSDSTTYNFKIQGTDIEGNVLSSDNYVFTTLTYPRLSNLKVEQVQQASTSTIKVTCDSNVPTTAKIVVSGNGGKEAATYEFSRSHELVIAGLKDNTQYTVTARGRDQYGNEAMAVSESYKTDFDTRPPYISNITVESSILGYGTEAKGQLVISWTTDEPATSQVEFGSGVAGSEYSSKTQEDSSLVENHVVIISDLKPSAPYHFKVVSKDGSGNSGISGDNSILTEQASESIVDLVIKSLQTTIGWIFNIFVRS